MMLTSRRAVFLLFVILQSCLGAYIVTEGSIGDLRTMIIANNEGMQLLLLRVERGAFQFMPCTSCSVSGAPFR